MRYIRLTAYPSLIGDNTIQTSCSRQAFNVDRIREIFALVSQADIYSIEHWSNHFKKYSNGLFCNSILLWSVRNSSFMNDAIAVAEGVYYVIDKFWSIVRA